MTDETETAEPLATEPAEASDRHPPREPTEPARGVAAAGPGPERERLRVGFLHIGRERSGLRRYGRILAAEAAGRPDLEVVERDAGSRDAPLASLRAAARDLAGVDAVHLQYKVADWDPRLGGIPRVEAVLRELHAPLVVTLHDVFERRGLRERWLSPSALGLRRLGLAAGRLVVHADEERRRLDGLLPARKIEVVPHFVEPVALPDRTAARHALHVEGRRVISLLGTMTKRRGHRLVLDALTRLSDDVVALFAGAPIEGRDHLERDLVAHARVLGVAGRVRFLGYVDDATLGQVLAATDVGLCPFREMSASGALATWIAVGCPIVVSDLPAIRELDALEPGALHRFAPYAPAVLAAAVERALAGATVTGEPDGRVQALAARLATPLAVERYVALYRAVSRER